MQVVANNIILKYFKKIDIFKIDLGHNLKGPVQLKPDPEIKFRIKDEFIKKHQTLTNRIIHKYGDIGSLRFYEDLQLPHNEFHIYRGEEIYEIMMHAEDFARVPKEYLSEVIQMIEGGTAGTPQELAAREEIQVRKEKIYTNMPEELERPDISMPIEQYLEALALRRKKLNEM